MTTDTILLFAVLVFEMNRWAHQAAKHVIVRGLVTKTDGVVVATCCVAWPPRTTNQVVAVCFLDRSRIAELGARFREESTDDTDF